MDDRPLPSALAAERSVLGAAIIDAPSCMPELVGILTEQDFQTQNHRMIWKALESMTKAADPIDTVTVRAKLRDVGNLEKVGGLGYLNQLVDGCPSVANAAVHADLVRRAADRRKLIAAASKAIEDAYEHDDPTEIRANLESALSGIGGASSQLVHISEVGPKAMQAKRQDRGFDIGLVDLQELTGGLYEGLNAISGMPGAGKTTLALQIVNRAINAGHKVVIASADQSRDDLFIAQLCNFARMDEQRVRTDEGAEAYKRLIASNVFYYDGRFDLSSILGALRICAGMGYTWVLVDYLGLIRVPGRKPAEAAEEAAKALKLLSRDLHLTVLLIISFTKPQDSDAPKMEEARGTMEVMHTVEQAWILQAPKDPISPTYCRVVKSRHAKCNKVELDLRGAQHRFANWGGGVDA